MEEIGAAKDGWFVLNSIQAFNFVGVCGFFTVIHKRHEPSKVSFHTGKRHGG